ncbi:hypothetical protein ACEWY4_008158 [Coilia grayii]|uniref:Ig-like domain-containing protein n=1 Tax=Coilia grayii TaxID=363190 RepID=A0ABD1KA30_9TELE
MGPLVLMILGFLLSQALSSDMQDVSYMSVEHNVTGVLGEEVYLHCVYTGDDTENMLFATWSESASKKKLAGYFGTTRYVTDGFSAPATAHNLTVRMQVLSVKAEGRYTCEFVTPERHVTDQVSLTVLVRPDVTIQVKEETENNTHYQSVSCFAANAKPAPQISWEINGGPPSGAIFSVQTESTRHGNGTVDLTSTLRFPTHLNDDSTVVCVVQHPALLKPRRTTALMQTFVAPDVTMETSLVVGPGADGGGIETLWVVNCTARGGRPQPKIAWILPEGENTLPYEATSGDGTFFSSVTLPAGGHEGDNVTCVVSHPKLTKVAERTLTLPTYYLSSVRLFNLSVNSSSREDMDVEVESVLLEEGEAGMAFRLEVQGSVPSYQTKCTKDGSSLPHGVELMNGVLSFRGPVAVRYAGHYECQAAFYKHKASAHLNVSVNPDIQTPIPVAPSIKVKTWPELDSVIIECAATGAVPAPNVSWSLPPGLTAEIARNTSSSDNGSVSATSTVSLPACLPEEHTLFCLVEHLLFEDPESREITLPACARPDIKVQSSIVWHEGMAHAKVECRVESVRPRASISWCVEDHNGTGRGVELQGGEDLTAEDGEGLEVVMGVLQLPLVDYQGMDVVCVVTHPSLLEMERRVAQLQAAAPPEIHVLLMENRNSSLLRAECAYSSEAENANITWLLPDNSTAVNVVLSLAIEGSKFKASASYEFTLASHEGSALTCLIQPTHGPVQRRVVQVRQYYISTLKVMNETTCVRGDGITVHRLVLQEHLTHQRVLLKIHGNLPYSQITCSRTDGSAVPPVREISPLTGALEFPWAVSKMDAGQYVCRASYHHHSASVYILVEVTSEEAQHLAFVSICFSSAVAITLILIIALCVLCKRHVHPSNKERRKNRESIATLTSLMHDPRSPELKKSALPGVKGHHYAELVSIVLVEKTTV